MLHTYVSTYTTAPSNVHLFKASFLDVQATYCGLAGLAAFSSMPDWLNLLRSTLSTSSIGTPCSNGRSPMYATCMEHEGAEKNVHVEALHRIATAGRPYHLPFPPVLLVTVAHSSLLGPYLCLTHVKK